MRSNMRIREFVQLVMVKVVLNLKSEVSKDYLNYAWWVLEPALFVAIFYVVFGVLLGGGGPGFVAFLVCGQIPFLWYSRSVTNASGSIMDAREIVARVYVPKAFFPVVVVLQDVVKQTFVMSLLLLFLVWYGIAPKIEWGFLPLVLLTQLLFVLASSLVAASIVPVLPDFRYIISTCLVLLMFGSGVFYSYKEVVTKEYQGLFLANPLAVLIKNYRQVLLEGTTPSWQELFAISMVCVVVIYVMFLLLAKFGGAYSKLVMQ